MNGWRWIDLVPARPRECVAAAPVDGEARGWLAAWDPCARPTPGALKIDARAIDPAGAPALVSLVRAPEGLTLAFDDVAVQHARRVVLARSTPAAVTSTLLSDDTRFMGALTAVRDGDRALLDADPFARILPALRLEVGAGVLGTMPAPAGPVIERYGSAQPWPADRFPEVAP